MQEILGLKRVIALCILLAVAGGQGAALHLYFLERNKELSREIRKTQSDTSRINKDADALRNDYDLITKQQEFVALLEKDNFVSDQNHAQARQRIADIQSITDILSASYSIALPQKIAKPDVVEVDHVVLSTNMKFEVTATDDLALYQFAYWIEKSFPGHIVLTNVSLERERKLDNNILKTMTQRGRLPLVKGTLTYLWRTVAPDEKDELEQTLQDLGLGGGL